MIKRILVNAKVLLVSSPVMRFYRVVGFGVVSTISVGLLDLVPQLDLSLETQGFIILVLTGIINAVDKYRRDRID